MVSLLEATKNKENNNYCIDKYLQEVIDITFGSRNNKSIFTHPLDLSYADLTGANFSNIDKDIYTIAFTRTILKNANLSNLNLTQFNFRGANLEGADLSNSKVDLNSCKEANLNNIKNMEGAVFQLHFNIKDLSFLNFKKVIILFSNDLEGYIFNNSIFEAENIDKQKYEDLLNDNNVIRWIMAPRNEKEMVPIIYSLDTKQYIHTFLSNLVIVISTQKTAYKNSLEIYNSCFKKVDTVKQARQNNEREVEIYEHADIKCFQVNQFSQIFTK